ncbi:MAG: NfeD family protein [Pyrinomonadaceae bacterium]
MDQYLLIPWVVLGVILIIAEIFTLGFVLFWFGIGAFAAALVAYLGFGFTTQAIVFALVSGVLTVMSKTIFEKYYPHRDEEKKMGIDTLPGKVGTVLSSSEGALNAARVDVFGSNWKALPVSDGMILTEGEKVEVVRVEGSTIYVKPAGKALPRGWQD